MNDTKIEWCDATWNPVTGCLHGCEYCYARKQVKRFEGWDDDGEDYDTRFPIRLYESLDNTRKDGKTVRASYPFGFKPTFHEYKLNEPQKMKKSHTIFVCSMADLFGEWVPDEWIEDVFAACEKAPQHTYLFLTKNPFRYEQLHQKGILRKSDNMWYGYSATKRGYDFWFDNQYNCFISIEPILENVDIVSTNWVIIGAETGNRKGKVIPRKEWLNRIIAECNEENIPVFMKNSLIPIIGEENMRREFPWSK